MPLVLAVESATDAAGVALADQDGLLAAVQVGRGRRHTESIAPAIQAVCRSGGVAVGDIDAVAVDVGPGLFTGLRVGIATAKGLATGLGVPMVAVGSLELLAAGVARAGVLDRRFGGPSSVVAVVDARRHEVFWARFDTADPWWPVPEVAPGPPAAGAHPGQQHDPEMRYQILVAASGPSATGPSVSGHSATGHSASGHSATGHSVEVAAPAALAATVAAMVHSAAGSRSHLASSGSGAPVGLGPDLGDDGASVLLVGDGALRYADELRQPGVILAARSLAFPPVEVLASIGVARVAAGLGVEPELVTARYLRDADARINWQRRLDPATTTDEPPSGRGGRRAHG